MAMTDECLHCAHYQNLEECRQAHCSLKGNWWAKEMIRRAENDAKTIQNLMRSIDDLEDELDTRED